MRILLSVAVWGEKYCKLFAEYSLATQLTPGNLQSLVSEHEVVYYIVTRRRDMRWLQGHKNLQALARHCNIVWDIIEDLGYRGAPKSDSDGKYSFLSTLQNLAFARSAEYDAIVFNYADFIWSNKSLTNSIKALQDGVEAVLTFCLPVDNIAGMRELDRHRSNSAESSTLDLSSQQVANIAVHNLHREAKLRFWDGPSFSKLPSYLIWPVEDKGLLVRAYHQTVLVLRVDKTNQNFSSGIHRSSLDGYFTAQLADQGKPVCISDASDIMIISLYDTVLDSSLSRHESREDSLRECLTKFVSEGQRHYAETPFYVKWQNSDPEAWEAVAKVSWTILDRFHQTTPANRLMFEKFVSNISSNSDIDRYGPNSTWRIEIYRWVLKIIHMSLTDVLHILLGANFCSAAHLRLKDWAFGKRAGDQ